MAGKFIDIKPEIGDIISSFVEKAATKLGLHFVLWYQGDPIWFVQKQEDDQEQSIVRRVQITPYWLSGKGEALYFVPQIFLIPKRDNVIKTLKQIDTANITSLPLRGIERHYNDFLAATEVAWHIAEQYDLTELHESIPRVG